MDSLVQQFLETGIYVRNWSPETSKTYRYALDSFSKLCPEVPTKAQLDGWVVAMRQAGMKPGGVNVYLRTIRSYLTWLHEEGHLKERVKVRLLPAPQKVIQAFTDAEVQRMLRTAPKTKNQKRTKAMVMFLLDTGARLSEMLTLQRKDVDFDQLVVKINGKTGERVVPISPDCRRILWKLMQGKDNASRTYVFGTRNDTQVTKRNGYRDTKAWAVHCDVKHFHPHLCRHTVAVMMLRSGCDIYRLSKLLGHADIQTTAIYLRSTGIDSLREAHSQFSPLRRLA